MKKTRRRTSAREEYYKSISTPIFSYWLNGNFRKAYPSIKAAVRDVGGNADAMKNSCNSLITTSANLYWRFYKMSVIVTQPELRRVNKRFSSKKVPVAASKAGETLTYYDSLTEAAEDLLVTRSAISQASAKQHKLKQVRGYTFSRNFKNPDLKTFGSL